MKSIILLFFTLVVTIPRINDVGSGLDIYSHLAKYPPLNIDLSDKQVLGSGVAGSAYKLSDTEVLKAVKVIRGLDTSVSHSPEEIKTLVKIASADPNYKVIIEMLFHELLAVEEMNAKLRHSRVLEYVLVSSEIFFDRDTAQIYYIAPLLDQTLSSYTAYMASLTDSPKKFISDNKQAIISFIYSTIYPVSLLHEAGYAHNDILGDNLMFDKDGKIVLIDMGLTANINEEAVKNDMNITGRYDLKMHEGIVEGFNEHSYGVDVVSLGKAIIGICALGDDWYTLYKQKYSGGLVFKDEQTIGPQFFALQPDFISNLTELFSSQCEPILDVIPPELFQEMVRIDPDTRISLSSLLKEMEKNNKKPIEPFNKNTVRFK